jgi:hypothetical protein
LALADEIGSLCCVNISGSRGSQWDGPHPDNLMNRGQGETTAEMGERLADRKICALAGWR